MNWLETLGIVGPMVGGAIGWLSASRIRRSQAIQSLQGTINQLAADNQNYLLRISELQGQLIEIKEQNVQLKEGQRRLEAEIKQLKGEQ